MTHTALVRTALVRTGLVRTGLIRAALIRAAGFRTGRTHAAPLALLLALSAPALAQEARVTAPSRIDAVTVYEDRALVTRRADVNLAQGVTRVTVEHLPQGLDAASLRARSNGVQVLGVEIEAVHLDRENQTVLRAAQEAFRVAKQKVASASLAEGEAESRWSLLGSIRATTGTNVSRTLGAGEAPDIEALAKVLDFIAERSASARDAYVTATAAVELAKNEAATVERRLEELQGAGAKEERRAIVTVRSATPASAELEVSYLIHGASWRPVYSLRVAEDFLSADLELGAMVAQNTGEPWGDVQLELTTARPSTGASPPEPNAWRIGLPRNEADADAGMTAPVAARAPARKMAARLAAPMEEAAKLRLHVARSGLVVAFSSHRRETVTSGAKPARVALGEFALAPEVTWTAFPRSTDDVFVTTELKNDTGVALPTGEARVFVGPDYVGPTTLADWGLDEKVRVGLGVDRQVEVERETLSQERSTEGLFSKDTVHARRYRISVDNHRARPIDLRILDQVPVSGDEDLEVKLTESSLAQFKLPKQEAENNAARGVLEWRPTLAGGTRLDLDFAFEVRHPKGDGVWGLD